MLGEHAQDAVDYALMRETRSDRAVPKVKKYKVTVARYDGTMDGMLVECASAASALMLYADRDDARSWSKVTVVDMNRHREV